jgi:integrase
MGEMFGLWWDDVDVNAKYLHIRRSIVRGEFTSPKSQKPRNVPMVSMLIDTLQELKALNYHRKHVICRESGELFTPNTFRAAVVSILTRAGIENTERPIHALRHTFCSHLAMRGASIKAIAQLAGHANISTTFQYMHLSPNAEFETINLIA